MSELKNKWLRQAAIVLFALPLAITVVLLALVIAANREAPLPSATQWQQSHQRAMQWLREHESEVLRDGNAALWWVLQTTAETTHDPYLVDLMARAMALHYPRADRTSAWKRLVQPQADVVAGLVDTAPLEPYQRFFYHAATCVPVALDEGDTRYFLSHNACRPQWRAVGLQDPVCSTHQLMGIALIKRMSCPAPTTLPQLEAALQADIAQQMTWDVQVRDAYVQRVLSLIWFGGGEHVKPIWLHRILAAQGADGGWSGGRQFPELPASLQPNALRARLVALGLKNPAQTPYPSDFHATAQGILLSALMSRMPPGSPSSR